MKHQIKDIAASQSVPWGTIAERIDENFAENETNIKNKQDIISDLETIRSGAEKGTTALQSENANSELEEPDSNYYTKGEVNELFTSYYTKEEVTELITSAIVRAINTPV